MTNPKVDFYFNKSKKWQSEIQLLREIMLDCQLKEELKWGVPTYMYQDSNIVLIHTFKEYCALLFFKGVLLNDPKKKLIQQTEHVQAARQLRFTNIDEILELKKEIPKYILEACELEDAGAKVPMKKTKDYDVPEELERILNADEKLKKAFRALTPGRQRGYLYHISQAKMVKTREARVEKAIPKIMEGKGFDED